MTVGPAVRAGAGRKIKGEESVESARLQRQVPSMGYAQRHGNALGEHFAPRAAGLPCSHGGAGVPPAFRGSSGGGVSRAFRRGRRDACTIIAVVIDHLVGEDEHVALEIVRERGRRPPASESP